MEDFDRRHRNRARFREIPGKLIFESHLFCVHGFVTLENIVFEFQFIEDNKMTGFFLRSEVDNTYEIKSVITFIFLT